MRVKIHQHFNLRLLGELDLSEKVINDLINADPRQVGQPHTAQVLTTIGTLTLFRVVGNGVPFVVTPTHDVAKAVMSGRANIIPLTF